MQICTFWCFLSSFMREGDCHNIFYWSYCPSLGIDTSTVLFVIPCSLQSNAQVTDLCSVGATSCWLCGWLVLRTIINSLFSHGPLCLPVKLCIFDETNLVQVQVPLKYKYLCKYHSCSNMRSRGDSVMRCTYAESIECICTGLAWPASLVVYSFTLS